MLPDELEKKIKLLSTEISYERERLSSDRMDISFGELINLYKNGELVIRPEYQRLFRWNLAQKTALIESVLLGIPIPPIFVAEDQNGIWELVDGLQRVSTFISFFGELSEDLTKIPEQNFEDNEIEEEETINLGNKWLLEAGSLIKQLDGLNVDTLPNNYRINLKRSVCRVEILRGESNIAMKYELFKRLNSGGSKLTAQEIRNAIYRGINPNLNILLNELSGNKQFLTLVTLSKHKRQELYDQELILRFIALYNNIDKINENLENYLNNYMEKAATNNTVDLQQMKILFSEVFELIFSLQDEKVFRNDRNLFVPAFFEGITIGLAQNITKYRTNKELLKNKIHELKNDYEFKSYSGSSSNSRSRIRNRLERANKVFLN